MSKILVTRKDIFQRSWNHVCWIHNNTQSKLYSNGKLIKIINETLEAELQNKPVFEDTANIFDSALVIGHYQHEMRGGFSTRKMFQGWLSELNILDKELAKKILRS